MNSENTAPENIEIKPKVIELKRFVDDLITSFKEVHNKNFEVEYAEFNSRYIDATTTSKSQNGVRLAQWALNLNRIVQDSNVKITLDQHRLCSTINALADSITEESGPHMPITLTMRQLENYAKEQEFRHKSLSSTLDKLESRLNNISNQLPPLEENVKEELGKVTALYTTGQTSIQQKEDQLNEMMGRAAFNAIAGDHKDTAATEKTTANAMRTGSLVCMCLAVLIAASSIVYNLFFTFDPLKSAFTLAVGILLSVPAAYLAKESSKHRAQQYNYHQTALDLKALSPYISTLPETEQHKIKIEIANKIFGQKDFTNIGDSSYPLDTQAIIMALVSKVGGPKG